MSEFRPLVDGRREQDPSMLLVVQLYRNGGTDEHSHICDDCVVVGLRQIKEFVDRSLVAMTVV